MSSSASNRPGKKPKRNHPHQPSQSSSHVNSATSAGASSFIAMHHPEKPSARAQGHEGKSRTWTTSIALPSSIVLNAQTMELRAWLVGQIARTCAIFCVTEIVVYNDNLPSTTTNTNPMASGSQNASYKPRGKYRDPTEGGENSTSGGAQQEGEDDPPTFLARILEYLETPQYLRRALFPLHPSLRLAGLLPPLDLPHHLRRDDKSPYREGVIVQTPSTQGSSSNHKRRNGSDASALLVDVGLWDPVHVDATKLDVIPELNSRVTVRMPKDEQSYADLISPSTPTLEQGLYWGYSVRVAPSLAHVFSSGPYASEGGYDLSIGTSERGVSVQDVLDEIPEFQHMILTLGPLSGLELVIASDPRINLGAEEAGDLFDHWINVIEGQGSRTVRTEEALPIALARLKHVLERKGI
ncbi:BZ3500_MvSof-1268-A1-R1_Chr1-1g00928 [Microbotryum saponariae]|uniref:BZ3500_MvSof-1268-A1-R1_Chr1-1g00928 protein n=1 Tax=Microbotryum saponariae TaxID=289078 RepID=A0A2X0KJL8_9BASI|nr:BZ3500_MvSof-1268-A1-R1_Chr1-1g00928 [Microbotryum saponariae]SCZ92957.1 BZ3501_MvSof-1269-A2-R1_Chr1-1g00525 [Microbotryum saponariae]